MKRLLLLIVLCCLFVSCSALQREGISKINTKVISIYQDDKVVLNEFECIGALSKFNSKSNVVKIKIKHYRASGAAIRGCNVRTLVFKGYDYTFEIYDKEIK